MTSEVVELNIPPHIRAIFEEWAKDYNAIPAPPADVIASGAPDPAEMAAFYHLLASPCQCTMLTKDCLRDLYTVALSNKESADNVSSIPAEAASVCQWLEPIMRANFTDLPTS